MPDIKINLDKILKERGMTQSDLVRLTGIRQQAISNLTRNKVERVFLEHLVKIMAALEINDVGEILSYIPDKQPDPLGEPLVNLDLPMGILIQLWDLKINTIRNLTDTDISKIKGLGPRRREAIRQAIEDYKRRHNLN